MSLPGPFLEALLSHLQPDQVLTEPEDCWAYGYDNSRKQSAPDCVTFAYDHDDVAFIVRQCHDHNIPVVARGRGTGTTGGAIPLRGGLVLSLERMDKIVNIDPANRAVTVQPGVLNQTLQDAVAEHGLFWPPDPSSAAFCTVGGNLAFNGAGPRAVKYGTPRENILGLTAVSGTGATLRTGVYTTKGVVGYDLTRLIVGCEGTLAIITEAVLKLTPVAESKRILRAIFSDIEHAARAVVAIMGQPVIPCALEFIDGNAIEMIRDYSDAELPHGAGAMLMIEVDGPEVAMPAAVESLTQAATNPGLVEIQAASTAAQADALWATRKALSPALRKVAPNKLNEDVVVPVSNIPALIKGLDELSRQYGIPIVNFGHAGNGNIHVNLLYDTQDPEQERNARPCLEKVFDLVIELKGTLSGEHGVGQEKRDYVQKEIDPVTLDLMRRIKAQFDPHNILNPDKIFPLQ